MKRFLHILLVAILAVACTQELIEPQDEPVNDGKVTIGFNISLPEPDVATKAMADQPGGQLKTLHLAIFDEVGYLLEYVQATPTLAQTDGTRYGYTATISLSNTTRIIHFIGNGPAQLRFGDEAKVMASVKSTGNEDLYWYRKEIPSITGGGTPFGPTDETRKQFRDIPLIRNFVKVVLKDNADKFALKSYAVVNTLNSGMLAAYNSRTADFVEYFEGAQQKHYSDLIAEGYDGNIPVGATFTTVGDTWSKAVNHDQPYFVYEREKPVDNPSYIIAYGTYAGKDQYYKINLRDNNGNYFPLLRNFEYTITLTEVERGGYDSPEKAAASTGSGDISSAIETSPLVYISDGIASLEVGYTEKVLTTDDPVYWPYEFYEDIAKKKLGSSSAMYLIVNNDSGATGDAIALINRKAVTKGNRIAISANPDSILVTPTVPASTPKTQTMSLYAEYTPTDKTVPVILQRTVKYIVMTKRTMQVECIPSEVPEKRGSEFDLAITIPGGLPMSMFPLRMLIEADKLSITPNNDHMPVETGLSLIDGKKTQSAFHFIKTLDWSDYDPLQPSTKLLCHFKTNKDISETAIHVFNEYFNPAQTYLDNYQFKEFTDLSYNGGATSILAGTGRNVTFEFKMPEILTVDEVVQPVEVALTNLEPNEEDYPDELKFNNSKGVYEYIPSKDTAEGKQTLHLKTISSETVKVELNSYHYLTASLEVPRQWMQFANLTISPDRLLQGVGRSASISFRMDADDTGYATRTVRVELDGLENAEGKNILEFKPVTSGNVAVTGTGTNRTVTVSGLYTSTEYDAVKFTVSASGYEDKVSALKNRSRGTFGGMTFSQNGSTVTTLSRASQEVDFNFTLSDYNPDDDSDMSITVTLDGFEPADDSPLTKAGEYTYKPTGKNCSIKLKTSAVTGNKQCKVTLSEPYYNDATSTIQQQRVSKEARLSFSNTTNRESQSKTQQVWKQNGITFTNNKNTSSTDVTNNSKPIRLYKNQSIELSVEGDIAKIVFDCNSNGYATTLRESIVSNASVSSDKVTVTLDGTSGEFTISKLAGQVRLDSITVTYYTD